MRRNDTSRMSAAELTAAAVADHTVLFDSDSASAVVLDGDDCAAFNVTEEELLIFLEINGRGQTLTLPFKDNERDLARALMELLKRAS